MFLNKFSFLNLKFKINVQYRTVITIRQNDLKIFKNDVKNKKQKMHLGVAENTEKCEIKSVYSESMEHETHF